MTGKTTKTVARTETQRPIFLYGIDSASFQSPVNGQIRNQINDKSNHKKKKIY